MKKARTITRKAPRKTTRKVTRKVTPLAKRNALVEQHLKLVHHVAKRYRKAGVDYENLVGEGHVGLIRAASKFQPKKGKRFSTYAIPWIKKHVHHALGHGFVVRIPEKKLKTAVKPQISNIEVAHEIGSSGGVRQAHARASVTHLLRRMKSLPAKEHAVLRARYFEGHRARHTPLTVRAVAKHLQISPGRVSQLEKSARRRLQGAA